MVSFYVIPRGKRCVRKSIFMHAVEQSLISFFERVAQKDRAQLKKLRQQNFNMEQRRWCFTLPDLCSFLQFQDDTFSCMDYQQFRQLIFNSPIHKSVKSFGAEITIADNQGNVDKSTYALVWRAGTT